VENLAGGSIFAHTAKLHNMPCSRCAPACRAKQAACWKSGGCTLLPYLALRGHLPYLHGLGVWCKRLKAGLCGAEYVAPVERRRWAAAPSLLSMVSSSNERGGDVGAGAGAYGQAPRTPSITRGAKTGSAHLPRLVRFMPLFFLSAARGARAAAAVTLAATVSRGSLRAACGGVGASLLFGIWAARRIARRGLLRIVRRRSLFLRSTPSACGDIPTVVALLAPADSSLPAPHVAQTCLQGGNGAFAPLRRCRLLARVFC